MRHGMGVRLTAAEMHLLDRAAKSMGLTKAELVRRWTLEALCELG